MMRVRHFLIVIGVFWVVIGYYNFQLHSSAHSKRAQLQKQQHRLQKADAGTLLAKQELQKQLQSWNVTQLSDLKASFGQSRTFDVSTDKWAIAVPDDIELFLLYYDPKWYEELYKDNWRVLFVLDKITPAIEEALSKTVEVLSDNVYPTPITIDLFTSFGGLNTQYETCAALSTHELIRDITHDCIKSLHIQNDSSARRRILGFLYAVYHEANTILNLDHGGLYFASPPRILPQQLPVSPIEASMIDAKGQLFVDPYEVCDRKRTTPKHPLFNYLYENDGFYKGEVKLAPQRLSLSIQKILPVNRDFDVSVGEDEGEWIDYNRDIVVTVPEHTFSMLTPQLNVYYRRAFWALPIAGKSEVGALSLQHTYSFWVEKLLWEIGDRIAYSNGTVIDYLLKIPAYINFHDDYDNYYDEDDEFDETKSDSVKLIKPKIFESSPSEALLGIARSIRSWKLGGYTFYQNLWQLSFIMHNHSLITTIDLLRIRMWLEDLQKIGYNEPLLASVEERELLQLKENHLGDKILIGDSGGWGLNNQKDNIVCTMAIGMANNLTTLLPDVYTLIDSNGQSFFLWEADGRKGKTTWKGNDSLPLHPFSAFWNDTFFIEQLSDLVTIVQEIPPYIEFNQSDFALPYVFHDTKWKYAVHLPHHSMIWRENLRNRHVLYLQNPFQIALWQTHMMFFAGNNLYFRRRFAAAFKISDVHMPKINYALKVLRTATKPFFRNGRYVAFHWNRQHKMYKEWEMMDSIPPSSLPEVINRYFKKVIGLPEGFPIFIFGAGIDKKEDVPKVLYEGFDLITVAELYPNMSAVDAENNLNQFFPLYNAEIAMRSFMYFSTNIFSTFDLEVCFYRHRVRNVTFDSIDICFGLHRSWRYLPTTIDPVFGTTLVEAVARLKDGPADLYEPSVYPIIKPGWEPDIWNIPSGLDDTWLNNTTPASEIDFKEVIEFFASEANGTLSWENFPRVNTK